MSHGICSSRRLCAVAVKFGRMSKKQRDSLYAEVQKHQQTQGGGGGAREDGGEDPIHGRAYSRSSAPALSDLDDITTLPDGLLFDLPLTPEGASEYCALELLGGSGGSSSSTQSSPEQSGPDFADGGPVDREYQLLHEPSLFAHSLLNGSPAGCSLLEIGGSSASPRAAFVTLCKSVPRGFLEGVSFFFFCRAHYPERGEVSPRDVSVQHRGAEESHVEPVHT